MLRVVLLSFVLALISLMPQAADARVTVQVDISEQRMRVYSIFCYGGDAIQGTNHVRQLGRRASHGCVRLSRGNAARLFSLVRRHGPRRVRIAIRH